MERIKEYLFNALISVYLMISFSFFFKQYETVVEVNASKYSDLEYFVRDNGIMLVLFSIIMMTIILNLYHHIEYWIFSSQKNIKAKVIVGYSNKEIVIDYYWTYIAKFSLVFGLCMIPTYMLCVPLKINNVPAILASFISSLVILSIILITMLGFILNRYNKGQYFNFKKGKIVTAIFQITISSVLIACGLMLVNDSYNKISPYVYYSKMEKGWALSLDAYSERSEMEIESNRGKYLSSLLKESVQISKEFEDKMLVNYQQSSYNEAIDKVHILNAKSLKILNINAERFDAYKDSEYQALYLDSSFSDRYKIGDIIENDPVDFIVADIEHKDDSLRIVTPLDFGDIREDFNAIALFNPKFLSTDPMYADFNFYSNFYFEGLEETDIADIKERLETDTLKYSISSIKEKQAQYNTQKIVTFTSYLFIGSFTMFFSVVGLLYLLQMDILSRKVEISVYQLLGYQKRSIYLKYATMIGLMYASSWILSQMLVFQTGALTPSVTVAVAGLLFIIYCITVTLTVKTVNQVQPVETIGGENV